MRLLFPSGWIGSRCHRWQVLIAPVFFVLLCRCARNCFLCPNCRNTLTVVPSDPPENVDSRMSPIVSTTLGEPPFFLYCNHCRWDSAEVGITFEKPTGLAGASSLPSSPSPAPYVPYMHVYDAESLILQHNYRSSKTRRRSRSNSSA